MCACLPLLSATACGNHVVIIGGASHMSPSYLNDIAIFDSLSLTWDLPFFSSPPQTNNTTSTPSSSSSTCFPPATVSPRTQSPFVTSFSSPSPPSPSHSHSPSLPVVRPPIPRAGHSAVAIGQRVIICGGICVRPCHPRRRYVTV